MQINPNANPEMIRGNGIKIILFGVIVAFFLMIIRTTFPSLFIPFLILEILMIAMGLFLIYSSYQIKKNKQLLK